MKMNKAHTNATAIAVIFAAALYITIGLVKEADAQSREGRGVRPDKHVEAVAAMVFIPGGDFDMGYEHAYEDERPGHRVNLDAFYIDRYEVSNARFEVFVDAIGYVTTAERDGYCWGYLEGGDDFQRLEGGNWRHPAGPGSSIENRMNHPVVCVSWHDAAAYAAWAGKRLPTEAEWESAARAGNDSHFVADIEMHHSGHGHTSAANDRSPSSKSHRGDHVSHMTTDSRPGENTVAANIWQGTWPEVNRLVDGYFYTAPGGSFEANTWGVHDMIGNVWEWTADWYAADYYRNSPVSNPTGAPSGENRVARGGSWFCSPNYCGAYSTHYRGASPPDHAFNNVGFRCVADESGDR